MTRRPDDDGLWVLQGDGTVVTPGASARIRLPGAVDVAAASAGGGWVLLAAGEIVAFGGAPSIESPPSRDPAVAIAPAIGGAGLWALGRAGTLRAFGDAEPYGDAVAEGPFVAAAAAAEGPWLLAESGRVVSPARGGQIAEMPPGDSFCSIAATPSGLGAWVLARSGNHVAFGDAWPTARAARRTGAATPRMPSFLIIGAAHAGTTTLWEHVRTHPDIHVPGLKEPRWYFAAGADWREHADAYRRLFEAAGDAIAVGEASTVYSDARRYPEVAGRIAEVIPDARLVYLIRHPVERLVAGYRYRSHYRLLPPIDEALLDPDFHSTSLYALQVEHYLRHFDREQLLVLTTDELASSPVETMARVFDHVGVDAAWHPPELGRAFNRRDEWRHFFVGELSDAASLAPSPGAVNALCDLLRPDLERLHAYTRVPAGWELAGA